MNILVIAHYQDDGSPYVIFVHDQVKEFVKLGHNVVVISPIVIGKKYKNMPEKMCRTADGVKIYYVKYVSLSNYGKNNVNIWSGYSNVKKTIELFLKDEKIDVIHAHTIGFDGAIAVKLKLLLGVPVVITTHGTDTIGEVNCGNSKRIVNICRKSDAVIAVSSKLKNILEQQDNSLKINVILNGFVKGKELNLEKDEYSILQVSSLIPQKKCDVTIRAFSQIHSIYKDATLTIIGEGSEKKKLIELCEEEGIIDYVFFFDQMDNEEVLEHMAKSKIFVMPSVNEGFGIVYLEAMSQRCITIGTKGEGIADLIESGVNGFLVDGNDVASLVEIFFKCIKGDESVLSIAENGYLSVDSISWENNAKQTILLYDQLIKKEG